jgi:tetratricopeptide (TPR) repeat protein
LEEMMFNNTRTLVICCLIIFLGAACSKKYQAQRYTKKGIKQARHENFSAALGYFEKGYAMDTSDTHLLLLKATALSDLGRHGEAETLFLSLIAKKYEDTDLFYNLSHLYFDEAKYDLALEYAERSIRMDSTITDNFSHKAAILVAMERYDEAMPYISRSLAMNGRDYAANLLMSDVYYYHADYREAEKFCRSAIHCNSKYFGAYFNLYKIYSKQNDKEQACGNYHQAVKRGMSRSEGHEPGMLRCE